MTLGVLEELEQLDREATPAPWTADLDKGADDEDIEACVTNKDVSLFIAIPTGINYAVPEGRWTDEHEAAKNLAWKTAGETRARADAALIAAARNALPELLRIASAVAASDPVTWLPGGGVWGCCICYGRGKEAKDAHEIGCAYEKARRLAGGGQ